MPRPDKPINPGRLNDPVASSRAHAWTKHGGPGGQTGFEDTPEEIEVEVDDLIIVHDGTVEQSSKWAQRSTAAHIDYGQEYVPTPVFEVEKQWTVARTVEGRTYTRSDSATYVEITPEAPQA
ncbi:MAG: hypothetical protein QNJ71_01860 [Acidimicrobiia bacterium]|nr:hypothetical protein [Acidimicrobiia bacterium]